jgi:hypothetical protein
MLTLGVQNVRPRYWPRFPRRRRGMVLRPTLVADGVGDAFQERFIKCGSQSNGLWKDSRPSGPGNAVETFIPPIVSRDTKTFDFRAFMKELRAFLQ